MKAALCKSLDGPDAIVIETIPDPVPKPGQAIVLTLPARTHVVVAAPGAARAAVKPAPRINRKPSAAAPSRLKVAAR